jgi:DNA/RNA-binding domain of Phe-tRNA-synthetase-like protein
MRQARRAAAVQSSGVDGNLASAYPDIMMFTVAHECTQLGLRAGAILFRGVRITPADAGLQDEITRGAQVLQSRFAEPGCVRSLPEVVAFQDLLRQVGVNPRKEQPSVERLLNYALKHGKLPCINNFVDVYNLISVRSLCSLGAHDLDRITTPITLRLLTGSETFVPLGRDQPQAVRAKEYGYVDAANRVLCRLDILQSEFSKVTADTTNVLLIIEGTSSHAPDYLRQVFQETIGMMTRTCGGQAEIMALPYS